MLSTTELFVEHIISGILSLIWILAVCFSMYEIEWSQISIIKEYWIILGLITTALSYPIGIFVDTLIDKILSNWDDNIKAEHFKHPNISVLQLIYTMKDANTTNYFTYNRFKSRIARSSFFNFALIGITSPIFILTNNSQLGINHHIVLSIMLFISFTLFAFAFLYIWYVATNSIHKKTKYLWDNNCNSKS